MPIQGDGTWLLNAINIGLPLNIEYALSADTGTDRVNGAKTVGIVKSIQETRFKVTFFKEFASDIQEKEFRQQLEQLQYGIEFMPYELETNQFAEELHEHLVLIDNINIDREGGKRLWLEYSISFIDMGHKSEFYGYIQYRAIPITSEFAELNNMRAVYLFYPCDVRFHSDTPTGSYGGEFGTMEYRKNPSTNTLSFMEGLGYNKAGIKAFMGNVQLFSPHATLGAGFEVNNGYFKMKWTEKSRPYYYRWSNSLRSWQDMDTAPIYIAVWNGSTIYRVTEAIDSKIEVKRFTTEYIEVEQTYQAPDGGLYAIMWKVMRGRNSVQIRVRGINFTMTKFQLYHYLNADYVEKVTFNGTTYSVTKAGAYDYNGMLTNPIFYCDFTSGVGGGLVGYVNHDMNTYSRIWHSAGGSYVGIECENRQTYAPKIWSSPVLYFQGVTSTTIRKEQAGYLIDAGMQVVHRSLVF